MTMPGSAGQRYISGLRPAFILAGLARPGCALSHRPVRPATQFPAHFGL